MGIKKSIDHYMKLKGIRMYSHLLMDIAHELGIKGEDAYRFAEREKSNFSKMLRGERPLKYDFIIPLEKIFGVPLAKMFDEDAYKLPPEKGEVPFNKGFRYYAYLDNPELYKNEFDLLLAKDGKSILNNVDEFGKSFLDYVVEYSAVNGIRYLHDEYGIKLKWYHNLFEFNKAKGTIWINFENCIEFARLVASMNDAELFYDIFDSYNMFFTNGHYGSEKTIFCQTEFLELILDNEKLFDSIFIRKPYEIKGNKKENGETMICELINPIINNCLKHTLDHLDKYHKQAVRILEFGIIHNRTVLNDRVFENLFICGELGRIADINDNNFIDIGIFADRETGDSEIDNLIRELRKFHTY